MAVNLAPGDAASASGLIGLIDCPSFIFIYFLFRRGQVCCVDSGQLLQQANNPRLQKCPTVGWHPGVGT